MGCLPDRAIRLPSHLKSRVAFHQNARQRHPCRNGEALASTTLDRKDTTQLGDPFAHAEQTEGVGSRRRIFRQPYAVVMDSQVTLPVDG